MGKETGFLEYKRDEDATIPVSDRIKNYNEFHVPLDAAARREQGARCMNCGVPMCQSAIKLKGMVTGCPLHNLIPEWNDEIYHDHIEHALSRLLKTSNFPEFTGRVCPSLCEKACICGMNGDSVTVHNNELYLIETAWQQGLMKPRIPAVRSGKKVAVIGAGPSGLAVADQLNHRGHNVTVFEREDRIGGLLMYGIPNQKLQKEVILRRMKLMEEEGVVFRTGCNIGFDGENARAADENNKRTTVASTNKQDGISAEAVDANCISVENLKKEFDAVVLCCGAKKARGLAVKGFDEVEGVHFAVDFLKSTTKSLLDSTASASVDGSKAVIGLSAAGSQEPKAGSFINAKGKDVVIVGGGDTGNDCTGTCIRHGCRSVTQIEMMPCPPEERLASNPWPEWPKVLKTDYGQEEAIALFGHDPRIYETTIKELVTKKGKLTAVKTVKVRFEDRKMIEIEGTEQTIKCDMLIVAAGFVGCEDYTAKAFGVDLGPRGTVATSSPETYKTSVDSIFTAGDMHRGQSLVVWAIVEGRHCARAVDEYLMGYSYMED